MAGEATGAALRARQAGGLHGARERVGEGPREVLAEAAAAALCQAHHARGARIPRPPPSPLLTGAIASGGGCQVQDHTASRLVAVAGSREEPRGGRMCPPRAAAQPPPLPVTGAGVSLAAAKCKRPPGC